MDGRPRAPPPHSSGLDHWKCPGSQLGLSPLSSCSPITHAISPSSYSSSACSDIFTCTPLLLSVLFARLRIKRLSTVVRVRYCARSRICPRFLVAAVCSSLPAISPTQPFLCSVFFIRRPLPFFSFSPNTFHILSGKYFVFASC